MLLQFLSFLRDSPGETAFREQFGRSRTKIDFQFIIIQLLINMGYYRHTTSAWHVAWLFAASVLPTLLYVFLPARLRRSWRTAILVELKLTMIVYVSKTFKNDFYPSDKPHSWPVFFHNLCFGCRALSFFGTHLGLQLPLALDLPIMVLAVGVMASTCIPRQCYQGPLPEGTQTLLRLDWQKVQHVIDVLDWPFGAIPHRPDSLKLTQQRACVAIYTWLLLVLAFFIPAAALWVAERRERARFQAESQAATRSNEGGEPPARQPPTAASNLEQRVSSDLFRCDPGSVVVAGVCAAEILWCVLRSLVAFLPLS